MGKFLELDKSVEREGVLRREFEFNTTDVIVDYVEG